MTPVASGRTEPRLDLAQVRSQFPALSRPNAHGIVPAYFDGPGGTQVPQRVLDAIRDYLINSNSNIEGEYEASIRTDELITQARVTGGAFVNGDPGGVAFGQNATTLNFLLTPPSPLTSWSWPRRSWPACTRCRAGGYSASRRPTRPAGYRRSACSATARPRTSWPANSAARVATPGTETSTPSTWSAPSAWTRSKACSGSASPTTTPWTRSPPSSTTWPPCDHRPGG